MWLTLKFRKLDLKNIQNIKPIYIAFGANLSNPKSTFAAAIKALGQNGAALVKMSGLWQSPAWPAGSGQPDYINACAQVEFGGSARQLLNILHEVEAQMGRIRSAKNAARTLDLDLLDFRGQIIHAEQGAAYATQHGHEPMIIPHPRMLLRGFVLFPLSEVAPDWHDPADGWHINDHICRLPLSDVAPMRRVGTMNWLPK